MPTIDANGRLVEDSIYPGKHPDGAARWRSASTGSPESRSGGTTSTRSRRGACGPRRDSRWTERRAGSSARAAGWPLLTRELGAHAMDLPAGQGHVAQHQADAA